jgi:hypothetical protein
MFRRRICSAATSASEVLCGCGIGRNENEISESEDDDVDTGQGSSVPTGAKKRKTFRRPQPTTLATATQEPGNAPPLGFLSTWGTDMGSVPPVSYPNWPWMQAQQMQSPHGPELAPWHLTCHGSCHWPNRPCHIQGSVFAAECTN